MTEEIIIDQPVMEKFVIEEKTETPVKAKRKRRTPAQMAADKAKASQVLKETLDISVEDKSIEYSVHKEDKINKVWGWEKKTYKLQELFNQIDNVLVKPRFGTYTYDRGDNTIEVRGPLGTIQSYQLSQDPKNIIRHIRAIPRVNIATGSGEDGNLSYINL